MQVLEHLPDHSRIWIYQTDRPLSGDEMLRGLQKLNLFLSSWAAHGTQLYGGAEFINPFILLIAVDEQRVPASGCSIDTLTRFIQDMGNTLTCDFFVRLKVTGILEGQWTQLDFSDVPLHTEFKLIDPTISELGEFRKKGLTYPTDSGLSAIFN